LRRLQSLGMRTEVLPVDVEPFRGTFFFCRACESVRRFLTLPRSSGELKVLLEGRDPTLEHERILIRLQEEDDGSCLWRYRGTGSENEGKIKALLG
jgi:hypothetical protein